MRKVTWFLVMLVVSWLTEPSGTSAQWVRQSSGTQRHLNDVVTLDSMTAIVVGDSGTILRTTDGGLTWATPASGTKQRLNAVAAISSQHVLYAAGDSVVCQSSDGGSSWSDTTMPYRFTAAGLAPPYWAADVFVGTDSGKMFISQAGMNDWSEVRDFAGGRILSLGFRHAPFNTYAMTVATQRYTYSSWVETNQFDSIANQSIMWDFLEGADVNGSTQYLVGGTGDFALEPLVLRRTLPDSTWTRFVNLPIGIYLTDAFSSRDTSLLYVCGSSGKIFQSSDSGNLWIEQYTGTALTLRAISFSDRAHGFAVGDSGTILSTRNGGATDVNESVGLPNSYSLLQNYPNPFNPSTRITYRLAEAARVTVKVFDVMGRQVATLVNETKPAGEYTTGWDGGRLPSGVYFYRLTAGKFSAVKKMLLMK